MNSSLRLLQQDLVTILETYPFSYHPIQCSRFREWPLVYSGCFPCCFGMVFLFRSSLKSIYTDVPDEAPDSFPLTWFLQLKPCIICIIDTSSCRCGVHSFVTFPQYLSWRDQLSALFLALALRMAPLLLHRLRDTNKPFKPLHTPKVQQNCLERFHTLNLKD